MLPCGATVPAREALEAESGRKALPLSLAQTVVRRLECRSDGDRVARYRQHASCTSGPCPSPERAPETY